MMRITKTSSTWTAALAALALAAAPGCVGQAPGGGNNNNDDDVDDGTGPDAGADDTPTPDGGGDTAELAVSGTVMGYLSMLEGTLDPVPNIALETEGITPPATATSLQEGAYELGVIPPGSTFYVNATPPEELDFAPTRNPSVTVTDQPVESPMYVASNAVINRRYGDIPDLLREPGLSMVVVDMRRNNGTPLEGVPLADITLTDQNQVALDVPTYFFGQQGVLDPAIIESTAINNRALVAFLNVPPGTYTFNAPYLDGQQNERIMTVPAMATADGFTLARTGGGGDGGGGGGGEEYTFTEDVYPILQKASQGGDACANCHTAGGQANILQFDLPAADVYQTVLNRAGIVNLEVPEESLLLTKPLYEDPPNHPNATYLDTLAENYQIMMMWIQQGALQ